jgi:hypothetical protein
MRMLTMNWYELNTKLKQQYVRAVLRSGTPWARPTLTPKSRTDAEDKRSILRAYSRYIDTESMCSSRGSALSSTSRTGSLSEPVSAATRRRGRYAQMISATHSQQSLQHSKHRKHSTSPRKQSCTVHQQRHTGGQRRRATHATGTAAADARGLALAQTLLLALHGRGALHSYTQRRISTHTPSLCTRRTHTSGRRPAAASARSWRVRQR